MSTLEALLEPRFHKTVTADEFEEYLAKFNDCHTTKEQIRKIAEIRRKFKNKDYAMRRRQEIKEEHEKLEKFCDLLLTENIRLRAEISELKRELCDTPPISGSWEDYY